MMYLGDFSVGAVINVPWNTFGASGESITMSGLATSGIEIYKNGNMTQRASDAGFTLLDTDGTDIDSTTGFHGISINTADNSDSGFFTAGADYWVQVNGLTINGVAVNHTAAVFSLENRRVAGELIKTTIATLASQTSFTLTAGSGDDDAYNNCIAIVSDIASGVQKAVGVISDYTGGTRTITLDADPGVFTMAAGDNITILATNAGLMATPADIVDEWESQAQADPTGFHVNVMEVNGIAQTGNDNGADINTIVTAVGTTIPGLIGTPSVDLATDIAALNTLIGTPADTDLATDLENIATAVAGISAGNGMPLEEFLAFGYFGE